MAAARPPNPLNCGAGVGFGRRLYYKVNRGPNILICCILIANNGHAKTPLGSLFVVSINTILCFGIIANIYL